MNSLNEILSVLNEKNIEFKIGDLKNFLENEPQKYFNHDVVIETYKTLNTFIDNFEEIKDYFFSFIHSYYHVVDIYNELDDVSFDSEIKIKIYYLPIITQIIENVFSNFYRIVNNHLGTDKPAMMLTPLKRSLQGKFDASFNEIDIDLRNAISHGKVSINGNMMFYTYSDKSVNPWQDKIEQIGISQIENLKNKLIDTSSAVFLAFMLYLNKMDLFDNLIMKNKDDSYTNNEFLKLYLKSKKVEVKNIADFSIENIKRIRGKLFIKKENISNDELKMIFHKATKEVRQLQTLQNPKDTRAKYHGEADIVYLNVFYDNVKRINYGHEELSDNFICNLTYYRAKTTLIPDYPFQSKHIKEEIPKHIIWWKNDEAKQ